MRGSRRGALSSADQPVCTGSTGHSGKRSRGGEGCAASHSAMRAATSASFSASSRSWRSTSCCVGPVASAMSGAVPKSWRDGSRRRSTCRIPRTWPSSATARETSTIIPPGSTRRNARKCGRMCTTCARCACSANRFGDDRLRHGRGAMTLPDVKILVIDIGGSHVKLLATGRRVPVKVPSGPTLTPARMVEEVLEATEGWSYDAVSIGYPGPVARIRPVKEPVNLGDGWVKFNYQRAFGVPVRIINDAAMQALGSYAGRTMLFLGLGTGLGNTLVMDGGCIVPMEMGHLPFANGKTYEDTIGEAGLKKTGKRKWRRNVKIIVELLASATNADYVVLGGGNVRHLDELPPNTRRGSNANAFRGGFRLWDDVAPRKKRAT